MEQDIEILEEKINNIKKYDTYRYDWTETDIQTVEHLIKAYKELEENSIPVSLVEEKIEEYRKKSEEYEKKKKDDFMGFWQIEFLKACHKYQSLQELLETRK